MGKRVIVHVYGCSKPKNIPEYVEDQLRLYNLYHNKQVETERWFFQAREALRCVHSPAYREMKGRDGAIQAKLDAAYGRVKTRNQKYRALTATDADRAEIEALYGEQRQNRKGQWDAIKGLRKSDAYKKFDRQLFLRKLMLKKLNYNLYGDQAPLFQKAHAGEELTKEECGGLAHAFEKLARDRSKEPLPMDWFKDLSDAFVRRAAGKAATDDDLLAFDLLTKHLGSREVPDRKPRPGDYGNLWWGTRGKIGHGIDIAVKAKKKDNAPVGYRRATRDGLLATQVQDGLTEAEFLSGADSRVRAAVLRTTAGKRPVRKALVGVRVGSTGRTPLFLEVKAAMHRPWPAGAKLKSAALVRRGGPLFRQSLYENGVKVPGSCVYAPQDGWTLQLTLEVPDERPRAAAGVAAVHLGWKVLAGGAVRVATWAGENPAAPFAIHPALADCVRVTPRPDGTEVGEVLLPVTRTAPDGRVTPSLADRQARCEDLRSILDRQFDLAVAAVVALRTRNDRLPAWFRAATETAGRWADHGRLLGLLGRWHAETPGASAAEKLRAWAAATGDAEALAELHYWSERELHLKQYEAGNRGRSLRWRKNFYATLAAAFVKRFNRVAFADADLSARGRKKGAEADVPEQGERAYSKLAAVGALRAAVKTAHPGFELADVPAEVLRRCPACRSAETPGRGREHTCSKCAATWDRSVTAAVNLLYAVNNPVAVPSDGQTTKKKGVANKVKPAGSKWTRLKADRSQTSAEMPFGQGVD